MTSLKPATHSTTYKDKLKNAKLLLELKVLIQHISDHEVSCLTQNQEQAKYTSRDSDVDSSKLESYDQPAASTSTSDPGEKPSSPTGKSQPESPESPEPSMNDVMDLCQPSNDSQTFIDIKQTQALYLSTDKIEPETRMTLHPRPNCDNKESSESASATPTSS